MHSNDNNSTKSIKVEKRQSNFLIYSQEHWGNIYKKRWKIHSILKKDREIWEN